MAKSHLTVRAQIYFSLILYQLYRQPTLCHRENEPMGLWFSHTAQNEWVKGDPGRSIFVEKLHCLLSTSGIRQLSCLYIPLVCLQSEQHPALLLAV